MKQAHILVSGRVQGVFYRANTRKKALELGLTGWVRNLRDGRVEIVAEGKESDLRKLIAWGHEGSPMASVIDAAVEWKEYTGEYTTFSIAR
jgi:acylphosphatase